ncbi:MAG: phosphate ABC transporter permease subunit PstC [Ignavibacteria bacterium]|jgi:phosphate ABC transporter permease protein PstC|nr:phosphate ABC transporter permease subunit PstC [Ignavibacteria bacterium]MCU7504211.1 phosphate ABC transporter permease subunit PstC [Ignavibacteria bacterium]MCU7516056.1 phosphate ABC transporter permease subunit PstC [Ignavibacteria bacterium]
MKLVGEKGVRRILMTVAFSAISALLLITLFIINEGLPFIFRYGLKDFLLSSDWNPAAGKFGIFPMITASLWVTFGAMITGAPLGVAVAIFLSEYAPRPMMKVVKPTIELLAAIPSVVYGFIGVMVLAPFIRSYFGGPGLSLLAGSIILGIMILPTVISISIDSIMAVPRSYREGSLALGATTWQTIHMITIKASKSGIIASIILGLGRAVGETMAVIMVAGNSVNIPHSALDSVRTLTANIALEMSYATGMHRQALFATGVVLFVGIIILNSIASVALRKRTSKR